MNGCTKGTGRSTQRARIVSGKLKSKSRKCKRCQVTKEISKFNKDRANKDGLRNYCKKCDIFFATQWQNTQSIGKKCTIPIEDICGKLN